MATLLAQPAIAEERPYHDPGPKTRTKYGVGRVVHEIPTFGINHSRFKHYQRHDLLWMAEYMTHRIKNLGAESAIVDCHTGGKQTPQVLGYILGVHVHYPFLLATEFWFERYVDQLAALPYRSPEVWYERKTSRSWIDPVVAVSSWSVLRPKCIWAPCGRKPNGFQWLYPLDDDEGRNGVSWLARRYSGPAMRWHEAPAVF